MSSSEYTRGSPSDCEDRISPRRAHCPIVVPDTPASSPTSPARKVPWALGLATTALKVCAGAADERARAATIARAPVDLDVAQILDPRRAALDTSSFSIHPNVAAVVVPGCRRDQEDAGAWSRTRRPRAVRRVTAALMSRARALRVTAAVRMIAVAASSTRSGMALGPCMVLLSGHWSSGQSGGRAG